MASNAAVVSGASSGIGADVAERLAAHMPVVGVDLDDPTPAVTAHVTGDVAADETWEAVATELRREDLTASALIHCAGIAVIRPLSETTTDEFRRVIDTNLVSAYIGTRVLSPDLIATAGSVVCVGSVASLVGQDASSGYVASKGGLLSLSRALAVELAPGEVRVNTVSPGPVATPLLDRHFESLPHGEQARMALERRLPIGRLLEPRDVAPLVVFLAIGESQAITGANFVVDGGLTATFDYGTDFAGGGGSA